jgi:hypothetical protein
MMSTTYDDFQRHWHDTDALAWLVSKRLEGDLDDLARQSRETTSHFKWLIAADRGGQARVWLHEFKPAHERRPGYASTVHNHRYAFTSTVLSGSYANHRYRVAFDPETLAVTAYDSLGSDALVPGDSYSMSPDEYHRVDDIEDGTRTLITEFAPSLNASYSVAPNDTYVVCHVPLEVRVRSLLQAQASLGTQTPFPTRGSAE